MATIIKFKTILVMILAFFSPSIVPQQETFEKEVELKQNQPVKLELKFADQINVKTWDKQKLYVKVKVEHNFEEKLDFELKENNEASVLEIIEKIGNLEKKNKKCNCCKLDIDYEVYLPANTKLTVNSISGNIEAKEMENSLKLETISGFVDVALNEKEKYDVKCSTISGSIYSNLNFDFREGVKFDIVGCKINSTINGGGKKIHLKTISGDLYLRKR